MSVWSAIRRALGAGSGRPAKVASGPAGDPNGLYMYFRCKNCGSTVAVRLNKLNDLSREEGGPGTLFVRKEVMDNKCFRLMTAEIWLDDAYNVVTADVSGGEMMTREEYESQHQTK